MLGLMVYLFMHKGDVPDNRPEIYRECSILMFNKWDRNRGIAVGISDDFRLMELFEVLAFNIFGQPDTEEGVSKSWLHDIIFDFFTSWYGSNAVALQSTNKVLEFVTGRAWVMCDAGPGIYRFTHRTFLEYFYARRLQAEAGEVVSLIRETLLPRIIDAEWDVVTHLALQIATFENGPQTVRAIEYLIGEARSAIDSRSHRYNYFMFVGRSLEYLSVPEPVLSQVVGLIARGAVEIGEYSGALAIQVLQNLCYYTRKRASVVEPLLNKILQEEFRTASEVGRQSITYIGGAKDLVLGVRSRTYSAGALWLVLGDLRKTIAENVGGQDVRPGRLVRNTIYLFGRGFSTGYETDRKAVFRFGPAGAPLDYQLIPTIALEVASRAAHRRYPSCAASSAWSQTARACPAHRTHPHRYKVRGGQHHCWRGIR
jgi:hypothetical protein